MSKADELAEKNCRLCPNNNNCTFVCMSVMLELWAGSNKSPHELDLMIRTAREKMRLKESIQ
jgi:hypothetical protein